MPQEIWIAIISGGSGLLLEFIRRMFKLWSLTHLNRSKIMREIADNQRADNVRVIEMMIGQARSDAKLIEELHLIAQRIDTAIDMREKMDTVVIDELKDLTKVVGKLEEGLRHMVVYRARRIED